MFNRAGRRVLLILALSLSAWARPLAQMGSIEGRVVRVGTNTPIEGARVGLMRTGQTLTEWNDNFYTSNTGQAGHFAFDDVEPGVYLITVEKEGYAKQVQGMNGKGEFALIAVTRGSMPTEESLRSLATVFRVEEKSAFRNILIPLTPAGIISGRVLGIDGRPLVGVEVKAWADFYSGGGVKMPMPLEDSATTDDRGEFRLLDVLPGTYYVVASPSNEDRKRYGPTFHPGLVDFDRAASVNVVSGQEVRLPGFSLQPPGPAYSVAGRLVERRATPGPLGDLTVTFVSRKSLVTMDLDDVEATISPDGSFLVDDVAPGDYWISVSKGFLGESVQSLVPIRVAGPAIGVEVPVQAPSTLQGRVVFDSQQQPNAADLARIEVGLELTEVSFSVLALIGPVPVHPASDGTFSLTGPSSGEFKVFAMHLPADMYLKDVRFQGRSGIDQVISLAGSRSDMLEIEIGTRGGQIRGLLLDEQGKPMPKVQAVLIPRGENPHPDHFKTNDSDASGRYAIRGIAPGNYTLLAWDEPETSYFNSEYVSRFLSRGRDVRVTEGSIEVLNLQVIPR